MLSKSQENSISHQSLQMPNSQLLKGSSKIVHNKGRKTTQHKRKKGQEEKKKSLIDGGGRGNKHRISLQYLEGWIPNGPQQSQPGGNMNRSSLAPSDRFSKPGPLQKLSSGLMYSYISRFHYHIKCSGIGLYSKYQELHAPSLSKRPWVPNPS